MSRPDLYYSIHKAIRAALFRAASLADRSDFANPAEAAEAVQGVLKLVALLESHARHEDTELMPIMARVAPEVHAELRAEHTRTDELHRELAAAAEQLLGAPTTERPAMGRRLRDGLWRLTAAHLRHLDHEEGEGTRALWAHCTDEELLAAQQRIIASIPPPVMAEVTALMLPAMSLPERTELLAAMAQKIPRPAFEALIGPARAALGERWEETAAAAGI